MEQVTDATPISKAITSGDVYDFGTHCNDFLVKREQSHATEAFLVRVPSQGSVPPHVHTDMEQTFVFTAGVGTVVLWCGDERKSLRCRPGDLAFVPAGWWHTTVSESIEELTYLTVNAFLPSAEREGTTARDHADVARAGFSERSATGFDAESDSSESSRVDLHRATETAFASNGGTVHPQHYQAFDATLLRDPSSYRVRRIGPFEYVRRVAPCARVMTVDIADTLAAVSDESLTVCVEGSQSPLSLKEPYAGSDLDLLVVIDVAEQLPAARSTVEKLTAMQDLVDVPVSPGIVHRSWLRLPGLYSAAELTSTSPDRRWWEATQAERFEEARRRIETAIRVLREPETLRAMRDQAFALLPVKMGTDELEEFRVVPRWLGMDVCA